MSRITKLSIRNFGVFQDFVWTHDLSLFNRYNLIYGWNGSGKTLISRVFAALEEGRKLDAGSAVLELSTGETVTDQDFAEWSQRLQVKVFNRDFVNRNVFGTKGELGPIIVLGEMSRAAQEELDKLKVEVQNSEAELKNLIRAKKEREKEFDRFCTESAREVREKLRGHGQDDYANYERPQFKRAADSLLGQDHHGLILDDTEASQLLGFVYSERRLSVQPVEFSLGMVNQLLKEARSLCGLSITATAIEELKARPDVNDWVRQGLELHRKHDTDKCLFCAQQLPRDRIVALEKHFSDQYNRLLYDLEMLLRKVRKAVEEFASLKLPDEARFYLDLQQRYRVYRQELDSMLKKCLETLSRVQAALEAKKSNPFANYDHEIPLVNFGDDAAHKINAIIKEHNERVEAHEDRVREAKRRIETSVVAQRLPEYKRLKDEIADLDNSVARAKSKIEQLKNRQVELERILIEHRRPAEELNRELASYLGHNEIQLEVSETGYRITRNGELAESLSEGEQTAIAFLYFLKTLDSRDFDKDNGIVVIDDPVSSLDSNSLYHAFGFMRSRVEGVGQLFILTHNFLFFRQVNRWLNSRIGMASYYMLEVTMENGTRKSRLVPLDPLLRKYESEYHYLFSVVYKASAYDGRGRLAQYHYLPNVARRLLEAFLEFRVPGHKRLEDKLKDISEGLVDPARVVRIERFCNVHSHLDVIDDEERDPVVLGEGPSIARDVMELIKAVDTDHFNRMVSLVDRQHGGG